MTGPVSRRRILLAATGGLVLAILVAVAGTVPAVRAELRASFTRLPAEYTELYFTQWPAVGGTTATVPLSLVHHGARDRAYQVRVRLVDGAGRVTATAAWTPDAEPDNPVRAVLRLPIGGTGRYLVSVTLAGNPQTLHYRLRPEGPA